MSIFSKKEKIFVNSDQQKDSLIEKLEKVGVEYVVRENEDIVNNSSSYIVIIQAKDKAKIA